MPANTSPDNIQYPVPGDQVAPLNTVFQNLADSTQTALTALAVGYRPMGAPVYFTSSGSFVKADYPGLRAIRVHTLGGAGGGGGCAATSSGQAADAGGGASGTYATSFITDIASLPASVTVTRGAGGAGGTAGNNDGSAGGASSFGSLVSASGGGGGSGSSNTSTTTRNSGGFGDATGTGDFIATGGDGFNGFVVSGTASRQGNGAAAPGPHGAGSRRRPTSGAGLAGAAPGGGGTGGTLDASSSAVAGGVGGNGIVVLELFA